MEECPGNMAAASSGFTERTPGAVGNVRKWRVVARFSQHRVMKFVTAQYAVCRSNWPVGKEPRPAITQVQRAFREARRMAEKSGHRVAHTVRILKPCTEHHVAAALAVDRTRARKLRKPGAEAVRGRQYARV
jgi:hypothetical protein